MSANEWADVIAKSLSKNIESVPKGFYTSREIAKMTNRGISHTKTLLGNLLNEGLAEMKIFKIQTASKQCPIPHYKIIK
jgi:hypothetical protein